jgi:hypothetical protein
MSRLTPTYPAGTNPARPGVYVTRPYKWKTKLVFQHWNGRTWGPIGLTAQQSHEFRKSASRYQNPAWIGLASPPKPTQGQKMTWIPVTTPPPITPLGYGDHGSAVVLCSFAGTMSGTRRYVLARHYTANDNDLGSEPQWLEEGRTGGRDISDYITHWQPLPPHPA